MSSGLEESKIGDGAPLYGKVVGLLGPEVFLVPCEWGTKKPLVTYVERPFEGTKSAACRALFDGEPCNVAVYLGKASGGLCAIDFDADEDLAAFLIVSKNVLATVTSIDQVVDSPQILHSKVARYGRCQKGPLCQ